MIVASTASIAFATAPAAHAVTGPNTDVIAAAGSDTTQDVMKDILNADGTTGKTFNIKAGNFQSTPLTVTADSYCNAKTYHNAKTGSWPATGSGQSAGELPAPDGSGEGRTSLQNSINAAAPFNGGGIEAGPNGCIDIARSSGYSSSFLTGNSEFFAFGIDALTWGTSSLNAPAVLTQSQLQGIFNCTYTDWSQVGGQPGPIQRVIFQSGSGTNSFFQSNLLGGFDPSTISSDSCPAVVRIQENQFYDMYHGSNTYGGGTGSASQYANAISPYSAGKWAYQAGHDTNPTVDLRAGFRPGGLTVDKGSATGPVWAVAWNGSTWQLNNSTVVGTTAAGTRSEKITTASGSSYATLVSTTSTATVNTTTNSFLITATAGTFSKAAVGSGISGTGVGASAVVIGFATDGTTDTLTVSVKSSATGTGITATLSSVFLPSDAGATLSGNANIPAGTKVDFIIDRTHAILSANATAAGSSVSTTITPVGQVKEVTVAATAANATLTGSAGTFASTDVGKTVDGSCVNGGTQITAVAGDGSTATISPSAKTTNAACAVKVGFTAISVGNIQNTTGTVAPFPGARFVYNVLAATSPSYTQARALVGYQDTASGAKSSLCSGGHDSTAGGSDDLVADNGFLPIPAHTSAGGNTNVTCYKFTP